MKWDELFHADTNLGKVNIEWIIIDLACSKMWETF